MDTENESLPTEERTSTEQQTDAIAQVPPQTGNAPLVGQPVTPVPQMQRITRFLEGFQATPGSNDTRIFGLSDCVIAVAFTLVIVNIRLPPEGLNESQLQSFITHNILSDEIPFYYISEALQQPLHHLERVVSGIDCLSSRPCGFFLPVWQPDREPAGVRLHTTGHQCDAPPDVGCCQG